MLVFCGRNECIAADMVKRPPPFADNDEIKVLNRKYSINQISYCEYYVCKWYMLPVAIIYKQQVAGLIIFKLDSGEKIQFKIFKKEVKSYKN